MIKYAPYSQSKIDTYITCPHRYKLQYIDKIKFTSDPHHLIRGKYVHYCLEFPDKFIDGTLDTSSFDLSDEHKVLCNQKVTEFMKTADYKQIMSEKLIGNELQIALDNGFNPRAFWRDKTNPNDTEPFYRGVIDKLTEVDDTTAHIIDYKTGKYKKLYDQLSYYAVWVFRSYPQYKKIRLSFYFIDAEMKLDYYIFQEDWTTPAIHLAEKIKCIETDDMWLPVVSKLCNYCPYNKECGDGSCTA